MCSELLTFRVWLRPIVAPRLTNTDGAATTPSSPGLIHHQSSHLLLPSLSLVDEMILDINSGTIPSKHALYL